MAGLGRPWTSKPWCPMPNRIDYASIEVPRILHERLALARLHHRQSYGELIEAMFEFWLEHGGYDPGHRPSVP